MCIRDRIKGLPMPFSQLFKFEGEYFMSMDLSGYDEHELEKMSVIADEYAEMCIRDSLNCLKRQPSEWTAGGDDHI